MSPTIRSVFGRRGRSSTFFTLPLAVSALVVAPASVSAATSCTFSNYRAADWINAYYFDADGINSQILVPSATSIGNLHGGASAADVYLFSGTQFIQLGWTIGSNEYFSTTTPVAFWGESDPSSPYGEDLFNLGSLSVGYHNFRLLRHSSGTYEIDIDGVQKLLSDKTFPQMRPAFNGEVTNSCVHMNGFAVRNPSPPYATLWYHAASEGWNPWTADQFSHTSPFHIAQYNGLGSAWALGPS